ncbi:hypothetical protein WG66_001671 [Moniliophthora roreri]|nr:hypothetical protein WG66_001671 [Moniliophthora roreri]
MSSPNVPPREAAYARDTGATMPTFIEEKRFIGLMRIVDRTSGRKVKALLSELLFLKLVWTSFWRSLNINRTKSFLAYSPIGPGPYESVNGGVHEIAFENRYKTRTTRQLSFRTFISSTATEQLNLPGTFLP